MKDRRRKKPRVRKRDWSEADLDAETRQPRRFRGLDVGLGAEAPDIDERFEDIQPNGVVISPYGVLAFVEIDGQEQLCRVAERLCTGKTSILAPGDLVLVDALDDDLCVSAVQRRRSKLSRPASKGQREQVIAVNVDHIVCVVAVAQPRFKAGVLDRLLIAADIGGIHPIVVVNKMDLTGETPREFEVYRDLELPLIFASCETGEGIDELRRLLENSVSVLAGQSGVGKTSLINCLHPDFELETQAVSAFNEKGRHTTTTSRLYHLGGGIDIIDTPGIRQLGVWALAKEEAALYFPDIAVLGERCRFR
ncbi:MAG TPA: ribosome small subunit-dependent GTPase A, partial [Candidatus Hydrogenedentes bacterium]|nr:ribosome small subunit-dependent GTPase A [Candidatus Hydrogenedentota bacterium]